MHSYALAMTALMFSGTTSVLIAQPMPAELLEYVSQAVCVDNAVKPTDALPIDRECTRWRPQRSDERAAYRKHDWPNDLRSTEAPLGYQASDSVVRQRGSRMQVVQTFDFGTHGRTFGRFDRGKGDGGQALVWVNDSASFAMTEDGSGGVQWFVDERCKRLPGQDERLLGWLAFRSDIRRDIWRQATARLNIVPNPNVCPSTFNDAFTRYRFDHVRFPFRVGGTERQHDLDVIVSEHYGGSDVRTADHLERFYMAKRLGLVRWERWANGNLRQPRDVTEQEQMLARTTRCPRLDGYGAPGQRWQLVDCRTWTTLVRQTGSWRVDDYDWSALRDFD